MARIIGVAGSCAVMASDRCYRKALSQEAIAQELRKGSGTQFNPEAVSVTLQMMHDALFPPSSHMLVRRKKTAETAVGNRV